MISKTLQIKHLCRFQDQQVSSKTQDSAAQAPELDAYRAQQEANSKTVVEYTDKFTGKALC